MNTILLGMASVWVAWGKMLLVRAGVMPASALVAICLWCGSGQIALAQEGPSFTLNAGTPTPKDFVDKGIRSNCVCPGRVHTPFVEGYLNKSFPGDPAGKAAKFKELSEYQPMGRMGQPHEIAALVAFLASDEAAFITGSAYDIDGGVTLLR